MYILKLDRLGGLDRAINLDKSVLFTIEKTGNWDQYNTIQWNLLSTKNIVIFLTV
jgi:hypothetical protein